MAAACELPRKTARFHECRLSLFDIRAPSSSKVHTFYVRHFSIFSDGTTVQDRFCNMMRQGNEEFSGSAVFCTEPEEKLWPLDRQKTRELVRGKENQEIGLRFS